MWNDNFISRKTWSVTPPPPPPLPPSIINTLGKVKASGVIWATLLNCLVVWSHIMSAWRNARRATQLGELLLLLTCLYDHKSWLFAIAQLNNSLGYIFLRPTRHFWNKLGPGNESKLLQKSLSHKEMVRHMKKCMRISTFSKFEEIYVKSHQRTQIPYKGLCYEKCFPCNHRNSVNWLIFISYLFGFFSTN